MSQYIYFWLSFSDLFIFPHVCISFPAIYSSFPLSSNPNVFVLSLFMRPSSSFSVLVPCHFPLLQFLIYLSIIIVVESSVRHNNVMTKGMDTLVFWSNKTMHFNFGRMHAHNIYCMISYESEVCSQITARLDRVWNVHVNSYIYIPRKLYDIAK